MKKETREDSFIKQPYYQGGDKALIEFVTKELKYPIKSLDVKTEGTVYIRYDINNKGAVVDAKIISGLDRYCNDEAIRVVKLLKFIVPKIPRGMRLTFHKNIRIHFNPNNVATKVTDIQDVIEPTPSAPVAPPRSMAIQYNYTPTVQSISTESPQEPPKPVTYTYTIKLS
jgi:TonB family protein